MRRQADFDKTTAKATAAVVVEHSQRCHRHRLRRRRRRRRFAISNDIAIRSSQSQHVVNTSAFASERLIR